MADKRVTDKASEQGWGSTVNAAAEQVKQTTDSIAESLRSTVGDQIADGLKTGGEYTKAGIQNTGEAVGLKGSKVRAHTPQVLIRLCGLPYRWLLYAQPAHDKAHEDLDNLAKDAKSKLADLYVLQ